MPNRILRDWTDSETIDALDAGAERFFVRLIMKVDDYGRYSANLKLLKSHLFPLKTDVRETEIARWLAECQKSGIIALYNIANKEYLQIVNFKQQLRQKSEKYPPPPACYADATQVQSTRTAIAHLKRNEVETESETNQNFYSRTREEKKIKDFDWFKNQFDELYLETLYFTHKGKDFEAALRQAYAHLAADPVRLHNAETADCRKLVNTFLVNQKPEKQHGIAKIITDTAERNALIAAKYAATGTE